MPGGRSTEGTGFPHAACSITRVGDEQIAEPIQLGSTDAVLLRPGDRQRVPSRTTPSAALDSLAYAESLCRYAGDRLDPFSLRCWIVRRLMLDDGLDHSSAERAFEHVVASERGAGRCTGGGPTGRLLVTRRGRQTCRELGRVAARSRALGEPPRSTDAESRPTAEQPLA